MSVDGSMIEAESPPSYVTFRTKVPKSNEPGPDLRTEFQAFQNKMFTMMESWFSRQDEKFSKLTTDFEDIKTSIQFLSGRYEELNKKSQELDGRLLSLEKKIDKTEHLNSNLVELESKLQKMEQKSRGLNVEISNLPERRGENLVKLIENLAKLINYPYSGSDIVALHRVPQVNPRSARPKNIIVKFSSLMARDNFLSSARLTKNITTDQLHIQGSVQKIYVNEHLTLLNKILFRKTREAAKQHGYRYVWVKHGSILVRANDTSATFAIQKENDILSKIKPLNNKS